MGKYFGTDGFRGTANENLTADHAFKVGRFIGWYYNELKKQKGDNTPARIVIGKDTRRSSYMFEYSLVGGITASGADAYLLHVTTTPSVAYISRVDGFDCAVMISASHNPYHDNGLKLINGNGEKMEDEVIDLIEAYLDDELEVFGQKWEKLPYATNEKIGRSIDYVSGRNRYIGYLISLGVYSFRGKKIGLDCANGAAWSIAKSVFDALGAETYVINAKPDGVNINDNAGSTHIEVLQKYVVENGLDAGFAYDGDADRCLCVDEKGNVVIMYNFCQMPYVYAALGKVEEALTEIRVRRQARMESVEFNYSIGTYANREDEYLAEKQRIENKDHEIEVAMEEENVARIQEILSENYQRNRQLIYERIGLEIPDEYDRIE